jgi:hypothetical protein
MAKGRVRSGVVVGALLLSVALLLWLAPEDRTLGVHTKLVFFHAALILASLLLYGLAALAALAFLVGRREPLFRVARGLWLAAVVTNAISLPTGLYAAHVIWGGFLWNEPRVLANAAMLLLSLVVVGVTLLSTNRRGVSLLYAVAAVAFGGMIGEAGRVMHPVNPIGRSDSWAIKLSFVALLLLVLGLAFEALRQFLRAQDEQPPRY